MFSDSPCRVRIPQVTRISVCRTASVTVTEDYMTMEVSGRAVGRDVEGH